jgi:hypothetical protein
MPLPNLEDGAQNVLPAHNLRFRERFIERRHPNGSIVPSFWKDSSIDISFKWKTFSTRTGKSIPPER